MSFHKIQIELVPGGGSRIKIDGMEIRHLTFINIRQDGNEFPTVEMTFRATVGGTIEMGEIKEPKP